MKRQSKPSALHQPRRLRKQPAIRRLEAAARVAHPNVAMPETARRRRRRNRQRLHMPTAALKQVVFSARWVSGLLLIISVYALLLIGRDNAFRLAAIPVEGASSIPPSEVIAASGLAGAHVFAVDPRQAALNIAAQPGVISASVELRWPNAASIAIKEDTPIAVWVQGGQQYWINQQGRLIPARLQTHGLLVIESELEAPQVPLTFVPRDVLDGALQLRQLRPNIDRLYFRPSSGLSYQDGRGWRVFFGVGADMPQKLVVYETLVEDLLARGLSPTYVSVSNQEKPYYRAGGA